MANANKAKFFRVVLGNIVICATVAALLFVTVTVGKAVEPSASSGEPYYSGKSDTKVSLMINVYWGTEYIEPMLDVMAKYNVKTTFFVGGSWAAANSETLKKIYDSGHEIGNHGYYHKDHSKIDGAYNRKEISSAHEIVKDILKIDMNLFAPPSGAFCAETLGVAEQLGYRTVMWTRDTIDWRDHDSELIHKRAVKNVKGGDLILMHPTECTLKALEGIIKDVLAKGLFIAPVSETLEKDVIL
ncbi:MAG: polysaccharide deacetylase family protein [Clostridiales bacterium]|nr:polysaccharide deacetylase family protein [Clostridiales bacterium]